MPTSEQQRRKCVLCKRETNRPMYISESFGFIERFSKGKVCEHCWTAISTQRKQHFYESDDEMKYYRNRIPHNHMKDAQKITAILEILVSEVMRLLRSENHVRKEI